MDSVNLLRYDRWRKINSPSFMKDYHADPNRHNSFDLSKMNGYVTAVLKPELTKDGFLKQSVIGGKADGKVKKTKLLIFCAE